MLSASPLSQNCDTCFYHQWFLQNFLQWFTFYPAVHPKRMRLNYPQSQETQFCLRSVVFPTQEWIYDHCGVPGTQQLSFLEKGKDNSKLEPTNFQKGANPLIGSSNKSLNGFRHAESEFGLQFWLSLFRPDDFVISSSEPITVFTRFP